MNGRLGTVLVLSSLLTVVGSSAYARLSYNSSMNGLTVNTVLANLAGSNAMVTNLGAANAVMNAGTPVAPGSNSFSTYGLNLSGVVLPTSAQEFPQPD